MTLLTLASLALALVTRTLASPPLVIQDESQTSFPSVVTETKVPVILGVMSRCPDAVLCESVFDQVLKRVANKVDLSLTFVAHTNTSEPDFGVSCKHGPTECAGNVHELCAMKYAPPTHFWEFVQCQNYQGIDKIGQPDTALKCANTAQIDWVNSGVGDCAGLDGSGKAPEGVLLLQNSAKATAELGIEKSCTILINGKQVCIHDGTWKQCENGHNVHDFVRQINHEYNKLNGNRNGEEDDF
ncbi:uncharacterized protein C8Q71DRAFT_731675 [Rhodofomes roseus]|uniref:Uncharacterized protein n=1 Tax=Rhodofomes roseus TaxID=34475 RepID=A0A4Y9YGC3_9APHY|nr:uncharacterized protein C8Q71DRAFT_731675 [Rhodofomes roseus]KAH9844184.1 hypothetical protein C8Q71DRAFT_731675 [Rhodofomes roseus]TFY61596.1 hypothetical protein EVJ58_g4413 [Rhodofomes roseus]